VSALDLDDLASAQPLGSVVAFPAASGSSTDPVVADLRAPSPTDAAEPVTVDEDI
jgi:hypothetical protein